MEPNLAISSSFIKHRVKDLNKLLKYGINRFEVGRVNQKDMAALERFVTGSSMDFGIHSPLPDPANYKEITRGSISTEGRKQLWDNARQTCLKARELKAGYVIFHLPWYSRSAASGYLKKHSGEDLKNYYLEDCRFLQKICKETGVPVNLELMYLHPEYFPLEWLAEILEEIPELGFCLDVGHLHCSLPDLPEHTLNSTIKVMLPRIKMVHLYNCKNGGHHKHRPAHPSHNPAKGWIDIPSLIGLVISANPNCRFVLEYSRNYIKSHREVMEGIEWIKSLLLHPTD